MSTPALVERDTALTDRFPIGVSVTFYEPWFGWIDAVVVAHDAPGDRLQIEYEEYEPGELDDIMDGEGVSSFGELCSSHPEALRVRRWWNAETVKEMQLQWSPLK